MESQHWKEVLDGRPVAAKNNYTKWQCPFHPDDKKHRGESAWSCHGYPNGTWYCFVCHARGDWKDLYVWSQTGRRLTPGEQIQPDDYPLRAAYRKAHEIERSGYYVEVTKTNRTTENPSVGRELSVAEQQFLYSAFVSVFQPQLARDQQAQQYLKQRGVDPKLPFLGMCRKRHYAPLRRLADHYDDPAFLELTGLQSRIHADGLTIQNMIVAAQLDHENQRLLYYQTRAIYPNMSMRYYNPNIRKRPLIFGDPANDQKAIGEGLFDVLWLVSRGWTGIVNMGTRVPLRTLDPELRRAYHNGFYLTDNDDAGRHAACSLKHETEYCGLTLRIIQTPRGHKDPDEWARALSYDKAERMLTMLVTKFRDSRNSLPQWSPEYQGDDRR